MNIPEWRRFCPVAAGILALIFAIGCAKSISPPGGPVDRTPPHVLSTAPVSGSVNIPLDSRMAIAFSEAIDNSSAARSIFISPELDPESKMKIKKDGIVITPREPLKAGRTYVVTVGTDLKDAHSVNLAQSFSFAFSTGTSIDSGSVTGVAFKDGKRSRGISLALFESDPEKSGLPVDSLRPDYITQSGDDGVYTFEYIPGGDYYLVAYEDQNKNRRINPGREPIGLPFNRVVLDTLRSRQAGMDIQVHKQDTSLLGFRSVSITPDNLLKVRFNKPLYRDDYQQLYNTMTLTSLAADSAPAKLHDYTALAAYPASDFAVYTDPLTADVSYRLTLNRGLLFPALADSLKTLTYDFKAVVVDDRNRPSLLESVPADKAVNVNPGDPMSFVFSEPLEAFPATGTIWLTDSDGQTTAVSVSPENSFVYSGLPEVMVEYGRKYTITVNAPVIRDRAGNSLSDSVMALEFSTIGLDTLGQISGRVNFADPDDAAYAVVVTFTPAGEGQLRKIRLPAGQAEMRADLLPGYYTVSAFLDRNDNDLFDFGSIIPYRLAEPFSSPPDTFRVRTRFESAGVVIEL